MPSASSQLLSSIQQNKNTSGTTSTGSASSRLLNSIQGSQIEGSQYPTFKSTSTIASSGPVVAQPQEQNIFQKAKTGILKFGANVAIQGANLVASTADFTVDFLAKGIEDKIRGSSRSAKQLIPIKNKMADKWRNFYETTAGQPTNKLKNFTQELLRIEYLQPSKEWSESSNKEKFTTRLPETILNIGPGIIASLGSFAINPALGFVVSAGSVADEVKTIAIDNGISENKALSLGLGTGLLVGWMDKLVPDKVFSPAQKNKFISGFAKRIIKTGLKEFGTEVVQEDIQLLAEATVREDLGMDEVINRNLMAGLGGLLGGAGVQTIVSFANGVKSGDIGGDDGTLPPGKYDPQEVLNKVLGSPEQNTKEGKALIKEALQAKENGTKVVVEGQVEEKEDLTKIIPKEGEAVIIDPDVFKKRANDFDPINHEKYSEMAKKEFARHLKINKNEVVKFTAGGSGSGKSEQVTGDIKRGFNGIILDGTFASYDSAIKKMNQAIDAKKIPEVYAILPDIERAWRFVLKRGDETGRYVPKDVFIEKHLGFLNTIKKLLQENKNIKIALKDTRLINNKEKAKNARFEYDSKKIIDILNQVNYNKTRLRSILPDAKIKETTSKESKGLEEAGRKTKRAIEKKSKTSSGLDRSDKSSQTKVNSKELSDYYSSQDQEAVGQAWFEVMAELDIAEAGSRTYDADGNVTGGISSTFPDWVPSELRISKLFDSVIKDISDPTNMTFPPNSQPRKQALYEELLAEIDSRAGTDSSSIIERIKNAKEETKQVTKTVPRSVEGTEGKAEEVKPLAKTLEKKKEELKKKVGKEPELPTLDKDPQMKFDEEGKKKEPIIKKGKGGIFDRVYEQLRLESNVEDNFDSISLKDQAKKATDYLETNPEDAIAVSLRQKPTPPGITYNAINIATSKQALANKDAQLYTDLVSARSIIVARQAQGLGLERLVNSLSTDTFVQEVFRSRLLKLSTKKGFVSRFKNVVKPGGKIKLGLDILSENATALKTKIDNKVKAKIASAQSIIDKLTCK